MSRDRDVERIIQILDSADESPRGRGAAWGQIGPIISGMAPGSELQTAVWSVAVRRLGEPVTVQRELEAFLYMQSPAWDQRRRDALRAAHHRCQLCNADAPLDVHHRTYERFGQERPDDLIALCRGCHDHFHERLHTGSSA